MHLRAALPTCLLLALAVSGCAPRDTAGNRVTGGTRVAGETATAAAPLAPARRVYVQDFALDVEATEPKTGLLGRPRLFQQLTGEDPAAHARRIVDEMATALVKDLNAAGFPAERVRAGGRCRSTAGSSAAPSPRPTAGTRSAAR
jgi:hypothetical protein